MKLIYLHGLGSSGSASTATGLRDQGFEVVAPDYQPHFCSKSLEQLGALVNSEKPDLVVGTSMGGYYAFQLAAATGLPAVIVNPCYAPAQQLKKYLDTPADDFANGGLIHFDQAMLDDFQPVPATQLDASRLCLITGLNDDLIPAAGQAAFFAEHDWRWHETQWGHRVDDCSELAELIHQHMAHQA